jgi:RNA polymerase sigma factor (sigma-70 family)
MSSSDLEQLRLYVQNGSQDAFAAVVNRHVDMVYSAARRQVGGNAELAEEITQRVFIVLAQKAASLNNETMLGGWLINTVRFVARDVQRKQKRREVHEQRAAEMAKQLRDASEPRKDDPWRCAEEVLDEALGRLGPQSRGMLVLRYFEGKSAREVGERLGISEDAARKRVSRAVDELREMFARRGVVMSATALVEALAATTLLKAPAELAGAAASAAMSSTSASAATGAAGAIKGGAAIMAMSNAKIAVAAAIGIIAVGGVVGGVQGVRKFFAPAGGTRTISLVTPGPKLTGIVRGPDGQPLVGADVFVATTQNRVSAYPGRTTRADGVSGDGGKFDVPKPDGSYVLVAHSAQGYVEISSQKLAGGTEIKMEPWGRIEGVVKVGDQPQPRTTVRLWRVGENDELVQHQTQVTTDAQGRFVIPRVAPGGTQLYRYLPGKSYRSANWRYAYVKPGKVTQVTIGGTGRAVEGRIETPPELAGIVKWTDTGKYTYDAEVRLQSLAQRPNHPPGETPEAYRAAEEAFAATPQGKLAKEWMFGSSFIVNPDGTFHVDDLPPGKYTLTVRCFEEDPEVSFLEDIARAETKFEVPAGVSASTLAPINIGTVAPTAVARMRPGSVAPDFSVTTLDGKTFNYADHKGKPLVVVFWGTFSNTGQLKDFGDFAQKWGKDDRLSIIGCFNAKDVDEAKQFIAKERLDFPHTADLKLMSKFDSSWPEAVVVSRDGKILQKHLKGEKLEKYVRIALGLPPDPATTKKSATKGK